MNCSIFTFLSFPFSQYQQTERKKEERETKKRGSEGEGRGERKEGREGGGRKRPDVYCDYFLIMHDIFGS
jgi:hypothetical protein